MDFRPTEVHDYDQVFRLLRDVRQVSQDFSLDKFQRIIRKNYGLCFVAEQDGAIVGNAFCMSDGATIAYIRKVAVAEEVRRRGIGSGLVWKVIEAVQKEGVSKVFLQVAPQNVASQNMFESLGFSIVDERYTLDMKI